MKSILAILLLLQLPATQIAIPTGQLIDPLTHRPCEPFASGPCHEAILAGKLPKWAILQEKPVNKDVFCTPNGNVVLGVQTTEAPCPCKHEVQSKDCEGPATENNKCTKYCNKQQCRCPVVCHYVEPQPDPENQ